MSRSVNKSKPNHQKKPNKLFLEIQKIGRKYGFDSSEISDIISCFYAHQISSIHFSLNGAFNKRKEFIEFCQKHCKRAPTVNKLIKLWNALNRKYNLLLNGPCYEISSDPNVYNEKSLVFISKKSTQKILTNRLISEPFTDAGRLYQYLNWTIRINKINKFIQFFSTTTNNIQLMVINSELHKNNEILYILCIANDVSSIKAQKWQFVELLTAEEITALITQKQKSGKPNRVPNVIQEDIMRGCVHCSVNSSVHCSVSSVHLPIGSRNGAIQFEKWRQNRLLSKQIICAKKIKQGRYAQLKSIQTGQDKKKKNQNPLQISLDELYAAIERALYSTHPRNELIPIVSILTGKKYNKNGKKNYSIDQLLPVQIKGRNWIGVIYRHDQPVGTLIDAYDITNKAILCNPSFNENTLRFFSNNITKIEVVYCLNNNNRTIVTPRVDKRDNDITAMPVYMNDNNNINNNINNNNNSNGAIAAAAIDKNKTTCGMYKFNTKTNTTTATTRIATPIPTTLIPTPNTNQAPLTIHTNTTGTNPNATPFSPNSPKTTTQRLSSIVEGQEMNQTILLNTLLRTSPINYNIVNNSLNLIHNTCTPLSTKSVPNTCTLNTMNTMPIPIPMSVSVPMSMPMPMFPTNATMNTLNTLNPMSINTFPNILNTLNPMTMPMLPTNATMNNYNNYNNYNITYRVQSQAINGILYSIPQPRH